MWNFSRYMSRKRAFSFFRGTLETMRAGTGVGTWASRTALKICCKLSSEYLRTLVATGEALARSFTPEGLAGWLDNLSPDLGGRKKLRRAIERATKGVAEGRSRQGRPRLWTKVILELIPFRILFQTGWLTRWVWRN